MAGSTIGLGVRIIGEDRMSAATKKAGRSLRGLQFQMEQARREAALFTSRMGALVLAVGATLVAGLGIATKAFAEVEENMITVQRLTELSDKSIKTLTKDFVTLSAGLPLSARELSRVGIIIAKLGISGPKDIKKLAFTAAQLARVSELTEEQSAAAFTRITQLMGLTFEQSENVGSALVELSATTLATAGNITEAAIRFAAFGKVMGLSADQVLAFAAITQNAGIRAQVAGSSMTKILTQMASRTAAFAKVLGISEPAFRELFGKQPALALLRFFEAFKGIDKFKISDKVKELGLNNVRVIRTVTGFAQVSNKLGDALENSARAFKENTRLTRAFDKANESLIARFKTLFGVITNLFIAIGEALAPVIKFVTNAFILFGRIILFLPPPFFVVIGAVLALVAAVTTIAGALLLFGGLLAATIFGMSQFAAVLGVTAANANIVNVSIAAMSITMKGALVSVVQMKTAFLVFAATAGQALKVFATTAILGLTKFFRKSTQRARGFENAGVNAIAGFAGKGLKSIKKFVVKSFAQLRLFSLNVRAQFVAMGATILKVLGPLGNAMAAFGIKMQIALGPFLPIIVTIAAAFTAIAVAGAFLRKAFATNFGGFKDFLLPVFKETGKAIEQLRVAFGKFEVAFVKAFQAAGIDIQKFSDVFKPVMNVIAGIIIFIIKLFVGLVDIITAMVKAMTKFVTTPAFKKFGGFIAATGGALTRIFTGGFAGAAIGAPGLQLQKGGIVRKPSFASIAERGPEAVTPLPALFRAIQAAVAQVAPAEARTVREIGRTVTQAAKIVIPITLELDGRMLAQVVKEIGEEDFTRFFNETENTGRGVV